jgi:hypothetical protein
MEIFTLDLSISYEKIFSKVLHLTITLTINHSSIVYAHWDVQV